MRATRADVPGGGVRNSFRRRAWVAFLEWTDPIFVGGHWTPQLIERAGGLHPLNPTAAPESAGAAAGPIGQTLRAAGPSIRVPAEVVAAIRPEFVVVCPCGLSLEDAWRETGLLAEQAWWRDLPAFRGAGGGCRWESDVQPPRAAAGGCV